MPVNTTFSILSSCLYICVVLINRRTILTGITRSLSWIIYCWLVNWWPTLKSNEWGSAPRLACWWGNFLLVCRDKATTISRITFKVCKHLCGEQIWVFTLFCLLLWNKLWLSCDGVLAQVVLYLLQDVASGHSILQFSYFHSSMSPLSTQSVC